MGSDRNRRFGVVPFFLPDIALSSVPSGADTTLFACHRTIGRVSAASGGSGTSVRRFPHSILLLRRGWSGHNGCRAVALGSGGVSFVGSVHGTLGVGSYGVGGGLGGRKAMRIELSAFRHNRFNRYRRCFVVVSELHATFVEVGLTVKHIGGIVRLLAVWLWRLVVTMVQYARFRAGISFGVGFGNVFRPFGKSTETVGGG